MASNTPAKGMDRIIKNKVEVKAKVKGKITTRVRDG
jgi:hypothetical protein